MLRIVLILTTVICCSCSNYIQKKSSVEKPIPHRLNGTYSSIRGNNYSCYRALSNDYSHARAGTIQLTTLGSKCLQMRCITPKDSVYTLLIKGKLREDGFRVKTKRRFRNWFLLFTDFERDKYLFFLEDGKLKLQSRSIHLIFFLMAPIMGADGKDCDEFERIQ